MFDIRLDLDLLGIEDDVPGVLQAMQAVMTGHFVYKSGKHGPGYVNKDRLYTNPIVAARLCNTLLNRVYTSNPNIIKEAEVVVAPAMGAIILGQWIAAMLPWYRYASGLNENDCFAASVYADKTEKGEGFELKRGYDKIVARKNVLLIEDIFNSGGSAVGAIDAVRRVGGEVIGVLGLVNRGGVTAAMLDVPFFSALLDNPMDQYLADGCCPLCKAGVPINTDVGHGREFLDAQKKPT